jgi:hypothetical protein
MPRARHPLPFEMKGIKNDQEAGKYILTENGITYSMNLEHTRLLKQYFRGNYIDNPTIEKWYKDLDRFTRKEIKITGKLELSTSDFYPDTTYE